MGEKEGALVVGVKVGVQVEGREKTVGAKVKVGLEVCFGDKKGEGEGLKVVKKGVGAKLGDFDGEKVRTFCGDFEGR